MYRNRSILWKWIISYLCLLLIPLLSIFVNYRNDVKNLKEEYMNVFSLSLSNLETAVNSRVTNMKNYQTYILNNENYQYLIRKNDLDNLFYYYAFEFKNDLSVYNEVNNPMNCAVYFHNQEFVCSADTGLNVGSYYTKMQSSSSGIPDYEEWFSFISSGYSNDHLIFTGLNAADGPCLILANTLSLRGNRYNTIFISTPLTDLTGILEVLPDYTYFVIQTTDDSLYFLDKNGQFSSNDPEVSEAWIAEAGLDAFSPGTDGQLILPEDYISISSPLEGTDFACRLVISPKAMEHRLYGIRRNFLLTLTLTLVLGLMGIVILLFINYQPVSDLLSRLNIIPGGRNEFSSILATYESLKKDYNSARSTVRQQNQKVLNDWLLSLLKGRISELDIRRQNLIPDMDSYSRIAMVGFMIPFSDQMKIEYDDLLFFIVDNIFRELFEGYTFYHIEDGRFVYYLFHLTDDTLSTSWHDAALEKTDYLCNLLNEKWKSPVVGVVSEPAENLISCKFLYRKMMESFELHDICGGSTTIAVQSMDNGESPEHVRELIEQELDAAVKEGNLKAALKVSTQIFSGSHNVPFTTQKAYAFDAFTLILGIFNNYISNPIMQMNALNYITPLMQTTTTEELESCFNEILLFICNEIAKKWQIEGKEIILKIRKYIEKHYTDQNLSVSSMAGVLERNPKYISRVFKEATGEGILDYITHYRITKARELMHLNQYTLIEISEMVGYSNVQTFRKAFIRLVGELPSKYNK